MSSMILTNTSDLPSYSNDGGGLDILDNMSEENSSLQIIGNGDDNIVLGSGDDTIFSGAGNDVIFGNDGNDFIVGGAGNDFIVGGAGEDILAGGTGEDIFFIGEDDFANGETDTILDFEVGTDRIQGIDPNEVELVGNDLIFTETGETIISFAGDGLPDDTDKFELF